MQILSIEDGNALDFKVTINLKENQTVAGSLAANIGNIHILLLHRVIRLIQVGRETIHNSDVSLQLYLMPLEVKQALKMLVSCFHWALGPSFKIITTGEKFVEMKVTMDGPTILIPETKENPQLFTFYLGISCPTYHIYC